MKRTFTWSLQWQLFAAMLLVLCATLLVFAWVIGNLFLTSWDRQLTTRLTLVATIAQSTLPLNRMGWYAPGDETTALYKQDIRQLVDFAKNYQLDHITILSPDGRVNVDSGGLIPGTATGYLSLVPRSPVATLTRLHRNRQGQWQKFLLFPLEHDLSLLLSAGSEMFTVIEQVNSRRNSILGVGILLALILSWVLSRYLGLKFSRLTKAFHALQTGHPQARVEAKGSDELAYLARAFNDMAGELESKTRLEREQNEKRISELKILSAGVAHEIRNPLGAISGLADLLARHSLMRSSADCQDLVDRIRSEVLRMDRIVTEVLAYARQPQLTIRSLALVEVVKTIRQQDPTCQILLAPQKPACIPVDAAGLATVFRNLLLNAREAAGPAGTVTVEVLSEGEQAIFLISDSGPGIPAEWREAVFQPFFSKKPKGTGLGLAIARNIVEAHKGTLRLIASSRGACFQVSLPLVQPGESLRA